MLARDQLWCCPTCGQPFRATALGVAMPPGKAEIVDSIKRAGDLGISSRELWTMHYGSRRKAAKLSVIRSHISQINELLASTRHVIVCEGRRHARWYLYIRK